MLPWLVWDYLYWEFITIFPSPHSPPHWWRNRCLWRNTHLDFVDNSFPEILRHHSNVQIPLCDVPKALEMGTSYRILYIWNSKEKKVLYPLEFFLIMIHSNSKVFGKGKEKRMFSYHILQNSSFAFYDISPCRVFKDSCVFIIALLYSGM